MKQLAAEERPRRARTAVSTAKVRSATLRKKRPAAGPPAKAKGAKVVLKSAAAVARAAAAFGTSGSGKRTPLINQRRQEISGPFVRKVILKVPTVGDKVGTSSRLVVNKEREKAVWRYKPTDIEPGMTTKATPKGPWQPSDCQSTLKRALGNVMRTDRRQTTHRGCKCCRLELLEQPAWLNWKAKFETNFKSELHTFEKNGGNSKKLSDKVRNPRCYPRRVKEAGVDVVLDAHPRLP